MTNITIVSDNEAVGMRLDVFLTECDELCDFSRSRLQKVITEGGVRVNGEISGKSRKLKGGEVITVTLPEVKAADIVPREMAIDVIYEDDDILVVNKPRGVVVHPAPGHYDNTLVNGLLYYCGTSLSGINGVMRPGIVHRHDKDTSGALVVAKNDLAHTALSAQFQNRSVKRVYHALVSGEMESDNTEKIINKNIKRSERDRKKMAVCDAGGKEAVTRYLVTAVYNGYSHVVCSLVTGRTHQIRVHMEYIGHPCLGDPVYRNNMNLKHGVRLDGQALHARELGFIHPAKKEYVEFISPLPGYFADLL